MVGYDLVLKSRQEEAAFLDRPRHGEEFELDNGVPRLTLGEESRAGLYYTPGSVGLLLVQDEPQALQAARISLDGCRATWVVKRQCRHG